MLRFKQWLQLLEGLTSRQKSVVSRWVPKREKVKSSDDEDDWTTQNALKLSQHVIPPGQNHIIVPMTGHAEHPAITAVKDHLKQHGYEIHDPSSGYAMDSTGNKEKVTSLLKKTGASGELKQGWNQADKTRPPSDFSATHHILISRNANDVAGCGTDKKFREACATLDDDASIVHGGHEARDKMPGELKVGTHVAYLVPKEFAHLPKDDQIDNSVSRVLLKPHTSISGHQILYPEGRAYSTPEVQDSKLESEFKRNLGQFAQQHFPMRDDIYYKNKGVYDDDLKSVRTNPASLENKRKQLMKKFKSEHFNSSDIRHAKEYGYYDDEVQKLSKERLINDLNVGEFNKFHYDQHKDDPEIEQLSKKSLENKLSDGQFDGEHYAEHISDKKIKDLSKNLLLNHIKSGNLDAAFSATPKTMSDYGNSHYDHHEEDRDVRQASEQALLDHLKKMSNDPKLKFNHEHYNNHYYGNNMIEELSKKALLSKLNKNAHDDSIKTHLLFHSNDPEVEQAYEDYKKRNNIE